MVARLAIVMEATEGGTRKHLRLLAVNLPEDEFEVHAVVSTLREPNFRSDIEAMRRGGVTVHVLNMVRSIRPLRDLTDYFRLKRILRRIRPDVVHSHGSKGGVLGRLAAHAGGVRGIVHTPHNYVFQWHAGLRRRFYLAVERFCARRCTRMISVGPGQERVALDARVAPEEKLVLIENAVEADRYGRVPRRDARRPLGLSEEALVVGNVARLVPQKGCRTFVRAAARIAREVKEARFVMVGGGPLTRSVRELADELGLKERLLMLGHREDVERIYPAFDAFVLSSIYEGLPYVILEAMASSLPVVATAIPGSGDLVRDGETGYLARPDDARDVAEKVLRLLGDAPARARMGGRGRRTVEESYGLSRFIRSHAELYRSLAP